MNDIASIMRLAPVIPVLTVERVEDARPLAQALVAGGLRALEITLRTPVALEVIRAMKDVEGAVVGAGTVLSPKHLDAAFQAGARFMVSPGLTRSIAEEARIAGVLLLPGVATATEVMRGFEYGFTHFKFFPAEQAGGASMLKAFAGPFAEARFCPTGGVSPENAASYLGLANVLCVGGSWIATRELIAAGAWTEITARAATAAALR